MVVRESRARGTDYAFMKQLRDLRCNSLNTNNLGLAAGGRSLKLLTINDLPFKKTLKKRLTLTFKRVILFEVSEGKQPKIRKQVKWNTGQRIHKTKKGKGSYDRKEDKPKKDN